ncbi:hypothetical protein NDU88_003734 [Pleurodeles waltl]|uniref:Uncharacterized protein n=1 Tax=Pleurodeles waltl TaxID=8319 RepID=A0AAV7UDC9_PLEWA|nr:hypothetical protein NDU88_003734 [Pleurodeles waltl]
MSIARATRRRTEKTEVAAGDPVALQRLPWPLLNSELLHRQEMQRGGTRKVMDMLQKPNSFPPFRRQEDDPSTPAQDFGEGPDDQAPATKEDIQLLLVNLHKDISSLCQDFTRDFSDFDESMRQRDSL